MVGEKLKIVTRATGKVGYNLIGNKVVVDETASVWLSDKQVKQLENNEIIPITLKVMKIQDKVTLYYDAGGQQ